MFRAFRESPATMTLCALWVVIFAVMAYQQGGLQQGGIHPHTARIYGYQTVREVMAGQIWRTLTATFIHFNLLHLGINLFGLYQLGRLLESWYGSGPFLGIYAFIAGLGNGIAVGLKWLLSNWFPGVAAFQDIPSGGGSTVLCGLIALLAVVGWRSRTRFGNVIKAEMVGILIFTAVLGALIPVIDNFGHLGGAIAGALVGLLHRLLLRIYERPRARQLVGAAAALVLLAAGLMQVRAYSPERPSPRPDVAALKRTLAADLMAVQLLRRLTVHYEAIAERHPDRKSVV